MCAVAERLGGRSSASAERERPLGYLIGVPVPIDQRHIVAFDEIRTVLPDLDCRHFAPLSPRLCVLCTLGVLCALAKLTCPLCVSEANVSFVGSRSELVSRSAIANPSFASPRGNPRWSSSSKSCR